MFSFDPSMIAASGGDYISATRFLIAETTEPSEISDEMITALFVATASTIGTDTNVQAARVYQTASDVAHYLYTLYSKQASFSSGGTSVQLKERAEQWGKLATDLSYQTRALLGIAAFLFSRRPALWSDEPSLDISAFYEAAGMNR